MELIPPWESAEPVPPDMFAQVRRRAIFECCKWDPQVEDVATLAPFPLLLRRDAWDEIAVLAERLAAEAAAAEEELLRRPELHRTLGLPWTVRRALRGARTLGASPGIARVLRFDFHWTNEGWRISEANTDVPGGFNEGSGFTRLMSTQYPGSEPPGDPAGSLAEAVVAGIAASPPGAAVALVHATAYSDDRQVMVFLAREIEAHGRRAVLAAPDHLRWQDGRATVDAGWFQGEAGAVVRFFPAEWLPNLPRSCGWKHFFRGARTPVSNPASALLTQSKRFPLVWDRLETPLPTWRELLPETRDPREADWQKDDGWVLKPSLGRVGDSIGLAGATPEAEWRPIRKDVRRSPGWWAAQRRFEAVPFQAAGEDPCFPCVGVYTVGGRAAGAYGRVARRPLINHLAQDIAVLLAPREEIPHGRVAAL